MPKNLANPKKHEENKVTPFLNVFKVPDSESEVRISIKILILKLSNLMTLIVHNCTKNYAEGIAWIGSFMKEYCIPCLIGRHPQVPYTNYGNHASKICKLLHVVTCGPFPVKMLHKKSFFWGLLNNKSNFGHVVLLSVKSDIFPDYKKVEALWETKSGNRVVAICMDGAKEFSLGNMAAYLKLQGITMQITAPYTHSQNGKAELLKMALRLYLLIRSSLCHSGAMWLSL